MPHCEEMITLTDVRSRPEADVARSEVSRKRTLDGSKFRRVDLARSL
jgi:hypothetical protein